MWEGCDCSMSGRVFVTGDTHGTIDIDKVIEFSKRPDLTSDDVLIICGDFGLVWSESQSEMEWRRWYSERPFTTLFIAGNHENYNLLNKLPHYNWNGITVRYVCNKVYHLMNGIYTINNKKILAIGGAESHDKEWRVETVDWWEQELPSATQLGNLKNAINSSDKKFDAIITHCAPDWAQDLFGYTDYPQNRLTHFLDDVSNEVQYRNWYCGHYHNDIGAIIDGATKFTLLYNDVEQII